MAQWSVYAQFNTTSNYCPDILETLFILIRCLLLMLVVMSLFDIDKYDEKLIGLCVKDQLC